MGNETIDRGKCVCVGGGVFSKWNLGAGSEIKILNDPK